MAVEPGIEPIVKCEIEPLSSGEYDVLLSLIQRIDNPELDLGDTYTFQIVTQVKFEHQCKMSFQYNTRTKGINVKRRQMNSNLKL